ncbi:MAG: hypothetical protein ACTJHC_02495 [Vagococcus sp.]
MSDELLELPNMYERHIRLGKEAYAKGYISVASEHFAEAYQLEDTLEANGWLVKSLVKDSKAKQAYNLLKEYEYAYLDDQYSDLYVSVLLQLAYFYELELLLSKLSTERANAYRPMYEASQSYWMAVDNQRLINVQRELMLLGEKNVAHQIKGVKQLRYLPKESMIKVGDVLLQDKRVIPFVRAHFLDALVQLKINHSFQCLTIESQCVTVNPSQLLTLRETYKDSPVLSRLKESLEQQNPSSLETVTEVLTLHIGCLYPFSKEVMEPASLWVDSYNMSYGMSIQHTVDVHSDEFKQVLNIQRKLDEEVMRLMSIS